MAFHPRNKKPQWFKAKLNSSSYVNHDTKVIWPQFQGHDDTVKEKLAAPQFQGYDDNFQEKLAVQLEQPEGESIIPPLSIQPAAAGSKREEPPIQQSDEMKPLLLDIGNYGLLYAYEKYYSTSHDSVRNAVDSEKYKWKKTKHPKKVVVVGAGPAGLVAGYELKRVGHDVVILERQHRVGGRVKTIGDSHFYKGLWGDCEFFVFLMSFQLHVQFFFTDGQY